MGEQSQGFRYRVDVWFYTGADFSAVGTFATMEQAERIARSYASDAKGVRIVVVEVAS